MIANATAKQPRKRPHTRRPAQTGSSEIAAGRSTVLVLGRGARSRRVIDLIQRLGIGCRAAAEPKPLLARLPADVGLLVLVPPLPDLSAERVCLRLREAPKSKDMPLLVVGSPPRQAGRLYRAGASGQFDWPAEKEAFVRTMLRLVGPGSKGRPRNARDVSLAARVEARIRSEQQAFGPLVTVQTQRGVVLLGGEVDAAWKRSELHRLVASMPGVADVSTAALIVPPTDIPDRAIARSIRGLLSATFGGEERTIAVRVRKGRVVIAGTARSRREMSRAVALAEQVPGVRRVENLIGVAPRAKGRDRALADRLSKLVRGQFSSIRVQVTIFGGVAVLSGRARSASERHAIESLVSTQAGVDQVVNKLV